MPSPIAHSVSGYVLAKFLPIDTQSGRQWDRQLFYPIFVAIFADFDFVPQLITGESFHRGITHSLLFAIVFSVVAGLVVSYLWKRPYQRLVLLTLMLYGSHLLLDFFTEGGRGMQLFWPLSSFFKSSIAIFPGVHHSRGLWDLSHFLPISFEAVYAALLLWLIRQRKHLKKGSHSDRLQS